MTDMEQKHQLKVALATENNRLGRNRLYAAYVQAGLTLVNLLISLTILIHLLGG